MDNILTGKDLAGVLVVQNGLLAYAVEESFFVKARSLGEVWHEAIRIDLD